MNKAGAVSVAGLTSEQKPKLNQDFALSAQTPFGNIAVVSDGAGSGVFSNISSKCLCKTVIRTLQTDPKIDDIAKFSELIVHSVEQSLRTLKRLSNIYQLEAGITDFSATLLVAVKSLDYCFCAHLGDGACMFFNSDDEPIKMSLPDNGEYLNETYFVTDKNWKTKLRCFELAERKANCLIMSDGVTPFALRNKDPFLNFTKPLLNFLKKSTLDESTTAVNAMLNSAEARKVSKDDKSIAWWISC